MKKFFRILIYILVGLLILFLLLNVFSPSKLKVQLEETVDAPVPICYNLVSDLERWSLWSPWFPLDSSATWEYTDNSSGVGARMHWKGNEKIGEGWQTITSVNKPDSISFSLEFKGFDGLASTDFHFQLLNEKTIVAWKFDGAATPFPMRFLNLLGKSGLKKSLKEGLSSLKHIAEKRANEKIYRGFEIQENELQQKNYVLTRKQVAMQNIQQFYTQSLGSLFALVQREGLELDGMPSGLYFSYDEKIGKTDMAAAIPIKEDIDIKNASTTSIAPGRAIQLDYYGDYDGISSAHTAIDEYLQDYGLMYEYPVIEEYITDPGEQPDPSKWLTRITYYLLNE